MAFIHLCIQQPEIALVDASKRTLDSESCKQSTKLSASCKVRFDPCTLEGLHLSDAGHRAVIRLAIENEDDKFQLL